MRIVDALKARNHLAPVHDPASEEQRQARRERQAAQHAHAVVSMMDEIPRRELDFEALGGRVIEHVASPDGDYYRPSSEGSAVHRRRRDQVLRRRGRRVPRMLERCTKPSSRARARTDARARSSAASSGRPRLGSGASR